MTPRDELVEEYTPTSWTRVYGSPSGVNFEAILNGKTEEGMLVQAISFTIKGKRPHQGQIIFKAIDKSITKGDEFTIAVKSVNEYDKVMTMYLLGVMISDTIKLDATLEFSFKIIVPWSAER